MKNLLKLALLVSAFAITNINAIKIQSGDQYFMSPDQITLVNDLGFDANVGGQLLPAGKSTVLDKSRIQQLKGQIKVENAATKQLAGWVGYLYVPENFEGKQLETYDPVMKNLSDITRGKGLIQ